MTQEVAEKVELSKLSYFENANKPTRWLAYKLKKEREKKAIKSLKAETGEKKSKQQELKEIVEKQGFRINKMSSWYCLTIKSRIDSA